MQYAKRLFNKKILFIKYSPPIKIQDDRYIIIVFILITTAKWLYNL